MGLFVIFLGVMTDIFTSLLGLRSDSESVSAVQQDGQYLLNRFQFDLARSTHTFTPSTLGVVTNTLQVSAGGATLTYSLSNANMAQLSDGSGTYTLNSANTIVKNLKFKRIGNGTGNDTVQVSYDVQTVNVQKTQPELKSYATTVLLQCDALSC